MRTWCRVAVVAACGVGVVLLARRLAAGRDPEATGPAIATPQWPPVPRPPARSRSVDDPA
ncbi:MAG: hypothetical protein M0007_08600 [Actinomycetota bacterium]|nr:hypothetical protein [Actinomycetota bacterium]